MNAVEQQLELRTVKSLIRKESNESNSLKIISVRCHVTTITLSTRNILMGADEKVNDICNQLENKELLIDCNKYDRHILCRNNLGTEDKHVYESISEVTLSEIVSSMIIFNWKIESYVLFKLINNGQLQHSLEQDDKLNIDYDAILKGRGVIGDRNSYYYSTINQDFYIILSDKQFCKFRYDKKYSIFYGMESKD